MDLGIRRGFAGITVLGLVAALVLSRGRLPSGAARQQVAPRPTPQRSTGKPIAMNPNLVGLEMKLGLQDKTPAVWDGDLRLSQGTVASIDVLRGGPGAHSRGGHFTCRSVEVRRPQGTTIFGPILRISVEAAMSARVTVQSAEGKFEFVLSDLPMGEAKPFLEGRVSVRRQDGAVRLTGPETEDDFPTMAQGPDGTIWLAYVAY